MNYIELINQFWQKDLEFNFTDKEIALFFYLLKVSNSIGWKNPFGLSNAMTIAKFGWGKSSFDTTKNRLKLAGVIDFKAGDGRGNVYQYELIEEKKGFKKVVQKNTLSDNLSDTLLPTLSNKKPATSINVKTNKTENLINKEAPVCFLRFGNEKIESKPSEFFLKNYEPTYKAMIMGYPLLNKEKLHEQFDKDFPSGYHFKDGNHLINCFRKTLISTLKQNSNTYPKGSISKTAKELKADEY